PSRDRADLRRRGARPQSRLFRVGGGEAEQGARLHAGRDRSRLSLVPLRPDDSGAQLLQVDGAPARQRSLQVRRVAEYEGASGTGDLEPSPAGRLPLSPVGPVSAAHRARRHPVGACRLPAHAVPELPLAPATVVPRGCGAAPRREASVMRTVLASAADRRYGYQLVNLLGSVRTNSDVFDDIVVFDLGLDPDQRRLVADVPGVAVESVPAFVPHWRQGRTWKTWIWT